MDPKYYYKALVDLTLLRRGRVRDRVVNFYEIFGVQNPDRPLTIWMPDEIATIIGLPDSGATSKGRRLSAIRAKLTRTVDKGGNLLTDGRPLERVVRPDGRYSWMVVDRSGLPDEALDIINRKTWGGVTWCRKAQIPYLMGQQRLDKIPAVFVWEYNGFSTWDVVAPALIDFAEPDTWEFWTEKAANAVSGKKHPLRKIEPVELRIQVGLTGLDRGIKKYRDKNPAWEPRDAWGWALHALASLVGTEPGWASQAPETVEKYRMTVENEGKFDTVHDLACKAVEKMKDQRQAMKGGVKDTNAESSHPTASLGPDGADGSTSVPALEDEALVDAVVAGSISGTLIDDDAIEAIIDNAHRE